MDLPTDPARTGADVTRVEAALNRAGIPVGGTIEPGAGHNEAVWCGRLPAALEFLLTAQAPAPSTRP